MFSWVTQSRSLVSISAFWCALARLVKGWSARLRARRMRVETTISASGPLPRNHSPSFGSRLSRFIGGPHAPDLVAQARRVFVTFLANRALELFKQFLFLDLPAPGAVG